MLFTFSRGPFPVDSRRLLAALGRPAALVPDERMVSAGWSLVARVPGTRRLSAIRQRVDRSILDAWPHPVRITFDEQSSAVAIWRHPDPQAAQSEAGPFPTGPDTQNALRVLHAVGIARSMLFEDQMLGLRAIHAPLEEIRALEDQRYADQMHFEAVAKALDAHRGP